KIMAVARGKPMSRSGAEGVFIIENGVVGALQADSETEKPVLASVYGPGRLCGLAFALSGDAKGSRATTRCLTNVSALHIPTADLLRVARRCPELALGLMRLLADDTQALALRHAQALHQPLEIRLAALFTQIGDFISGDDWRPTVDLGKMAQSFIAELLGVSREHINRTLTMWEKSGLIFQAKTGALIIQNRKRLAAIAADPAAPHPDRPSIGATIDNEWLWEIDSYLDLGLNETAFHLASEAARRAPRDMRFKHRAVLATARSGAMVEALDLIETLKIPTDTSDEELACLRPRILRDMAFSADEDAVRRRHLVDSAEEYAKAFEACRTTYSGVNAASGYAFLGDAERSRGLAAVVADIAADALEPLEDDEPSYWLRATVAECRLLQGDPQSATLLFQAACHAADVTPGKKAATRGQLRRLKEKTAIDDAWIDRAVPQAQPLFFSGPLAARNATETDDQIDALIDALEDFLDRNAVGWACGALASGSDIAIAETLLEHGVALHVYLPIDPGSFMKSSVAAFGDEWSERYIACMRAAASIDWNRRAQTACGAAFKLGALAAMGKTVRHARALQTDPVGFFAVQKDKTADASLSVANRDLWTAAGFVAERTEAVWPAKGPTRTTEPNQVYYALVSEGAENGSGVKAAGDGAHAHLAIRDRACDAWLYDTIEAALAAADAFLKTDAAAASRLWLDAGAFASNQPSPQETVDALITASCRPQTDPGALYASDVFATAATISAPGARRFDYLGFASVQEKVDPCPLYLVSA
ncbi:MAG: tetratricopeptide repeat-containing protein, partial [Pseudomonadota bacterium]